MTKASNTLEVFKTRLAEAGAEILAPTNPYEALRFRALYGTGIVWVNKKGKQTWGAEAQMAHDHVKAQKGSLAPVTIINRGPNAKKAPTLLARDGPNCFFCGKPLDNDITVEHLIAIAHGGPNHISNLFLAHAECNQKAGHMSAPEKVALPLENRK